MKKSKWHIFIVVLLSSLYIITSIISMIHVVSFFNMSNNKTMSIILAAAFEVGAMASLISIIIMKSTNKMIVWSLFILLTSMQIMGNMYYTYINLTDFTGWIELFGLTDLDIYAQKRILSIISGGILPIIALGYIKVLSDYLNIKNYYNNFVNDTNQDDIIKKKYDNIDNADINNIKFNNKKRIPKTIPGL